MENRPDDMRVMVVDDEKGIRDGSERILTRMDCQVLKASRGDEALEILNEEKASIVLLDMKMPGLHGTELLARMLDQGITPPVVVCSAHDQHRQEAPVTRYPKLRYLVKPVPAETMEKAVRDMLELVKK